MPLTGRILGRETVAWTLKYVMLIVTPRYRVSGGVREAASLPGQC